MPQIRLTAQVVSGNRRGGRGDVVDWPLPSCTALVDAGAAEWYEPPKAKAKAAKPESEDG
jgi:hypothetical protein